MPDMHLIDVRADMALDAAAGAVEVLLVGWPLAAGEALADELRLRGVAARPVSVAVLPALAAGGGAAVLAIGPELSPVAALDILRDVTGADLPRPWVLLALAAGERVEVFQELIDGDRLFFVARHPPSVPETVEILVAASKRAAPPPSGDDTEGEGSGGLPELLQRLERETDFDSALRQIADEARIAADAERAQVWLYDERSESLTDGTRRESAAVGLTSYVARTGRGLAVEHLGDDSRYDPDLDNEGGDVWERLLAWPMMTPPGEGSPVLAVLTLIRSPQAPPFGDVERRRIDRTTRLLAPALARLVDDREIEARAAERNTAIRDDMAQLYRGEALRQYQRGSTDEGHLLEIEPGWTRRAYGVILALLGAALLFSVLAHVDRQAEGVGVVRGRRLVAVVPARYLSELRPASPLRFELSGQPLAVGSVSRKILGASEARRLLGPDGAALWTSPEAVVRIEASLPADRGDYSDGVAGRVRVRLGRERVLFALIPALRWLHV
jgi:hypothetical protein